MELIQWIILEFYPIVYNYNLLKVGRTNFSNVYKLYQMSRVRVIIPTNMQVHDLLLYKLCDCFRNTNQPGKFLEDLARSEDHPLVGLFFFRKSLAHEL